MIRPWKVSDHHATAHKVASTLGRILSLVAGVQGVIHLATMTNFSRNPNDMIPQTVAGVTNTMSAAADAPSVARFVYTSTVVAAVAPTPDVEFRIHDGMWNDAAVEAAWTEPFDVPGKEWAVYAASKTEAERAVWAFVEK